MPETEKEPNGTNERSPIDEQLAGGVIILSDDFRKRLGATLVPKKEEIVIDKEKPESKRANAFATKTGMYFSKDVVEAMIHGYVDSTTLKSTLDQAIKIVKRMAEKESANFELILGTVEGMLEDMEITAEGHNARHPSSTMMRRFPDLKISFGVSVKQYSDNIEAIIMALERAREVVGMTNEKNIGDVAKCLRIFVGV